MKEIDTEIQIQADSEQVWQVLTDLKHFSQWNPFIRSAKGELKVGSQVEIVVHPHGSSEISFRTRILKIEPNHELRWLGQLLIPGLLDTEQILLSNRSPKTKYGFNKSSGTGAY